MKKSYYPIPPFYFNISSKIGYFSFFFIYKLLKQIIAKLLIKIIKKNNNS